MTPRTRARPDASALTDEAERYLAEAEAAADPAARRAALERHRALFSAEAIGTLREAVAGAEGDAAEPARRLLALAVEGYVAEATAEITDGVEAAEADAVVIWRGERLPYAAVPVRVAALSDRIERNALDRSLAEADDAINPLRAERLAARQAAYRTLGWDGMVSAAAEVHRFSPVTLAVDLQRFISASETVYYAALRRYLALIDIEQGDGTDADLRHLLRGGAWDHWFDARRAPAAAASTLRGLGADPAPIDVDLAGWLGWSAALEGAGRAAAAAEAGRSRTRIERLLADPSVATGYGILLADLVGEPAWVAEQTGMPELELPGWLDFAAFRRLHRLRLETAMLLYELRLDREDDSGVARAYYAGVVGLLTGVIMPEAGYLRRSGQPLASAHQLRAEILASCLVDLLRRRYGEPWWRDPQAGSMLRQAWGRGSAWDAEAVVAHLGYDPYDWRPVLRQIRTRLIGEMSGYGGPNITTRAGTRKV